MRTPERAEQLLELGLDRVILGTLAVEEPDLVWGLAQRFPGRIVVGIDARDGLVATRGWLSTSALPAPEVARRFEGSGVAALITTDIATDGTLAGPNIDFLRAMAQATSIPVIASGGVGSLGDLLSLLVLAPSGWRGRDRPGPLRRPARPGGGVAGHRTGALAGSGPPAGCVSRPGLGAWPA